MSGQLGLIFGAGITVNSLAAGGVADFSGRMFRYAVGPDIVLERIYRLLKFTVKLLGLPLVAG